eukprot:6427011-Amphidinium_carterae.1
MQTVATQKSANVTRLELGRSVLQEEQTMHLPHLFVPLDRIEYNEVQIAPICVHPKYVTIV